MIQNGQLQLETTSFDIRGVIEEVMGIASMKLKIKNINYSTYIDDSVPTMIYSDSNRVRQVVLNLVENAIKHNVSTGSVSISVSREDEFLKIEVSDTGNGISSSKLATLFSSTKYGSSPGARMSVSLPIAYQLSKLLGGNLQVTSKPGFGSTFSLFIKLQPVLRDDLTLPEIPPQSPLSDYNVEEECQIVPKVQHPHPSLKVRHVSYTNNHLHTKLCYELRKIGRDSPASDSKLKRYAGPTPQIPLTKTQFLLEQDTDCSKVHTERNASINDYFVIPGSAAGATNRGHITSRTSAFKFETQGAAVGTEKKNPPKGSTNKVRHSLLQLHDSETCEYEKRKPKGPSLSCIPFGFFDVWTKTSRLKKQTIIGASQEDLCGRREERLNPQQDLEKLKATVLRIAAGVRKKRCTKFCADILVVDDNEFNRYLLVQLLSKYGFACKTVPHFIRFCPRREAQKNSGKKWKGSS